MKKVLLALLAVIMIISVCSCKKEVSEDNADNKVDTNAENEVYTNEDSEAETDPIVSNTAEVTDTSEVTEEIKFFVSDEDVYAIDTPYGPIYYPVEYKDTVITEASQTENVYSIKFSVQLDEKSVPLYTVIFGGESPEGYIASGTLKTEDGQSIRVYFEDLSAAGAASALSKASMETYLAMSEDINVIMSNLVYTSEMELD